MDTNGVIGEVPGIKLSPEMERQRKLEADILSIEGIFFAINSATFNVRFMDALKRGMEYLGNIHASLLAQMTPEQIEAMRKKYNQAPTPVPTPPAVA